MPIRVMRVLAKINVRPSDQKKNTKYTTNDERKFLLLQSAREIAMKLT